MYTIKFSACSERSDWSRDIMFSFREQNNYASKWIRTEKIYTVGNQLKSIWGHWLLMIFWVEAGMFQQSTTQEVLER